MNNDLTKFLMLIYGTALLVFFVNILYLVYSKVKKWLEKEKKMSSFEIHWEMPEGQTFSSYFYKGYVKGEHIVNVEVVKNNLKKANLKFVNSKHGVEFQEKD